MKKEPNGEKNNSETKGLHQFSLRTIQNVFIHKMYVSITLAIKRSICYIIRDRLIAYFSVRRVVDNNKKKNPHYNTSNAKKELKKKKTDLIQCLGNGGTELFYFIF